MSIIFEYDSISSVKDKLVVYVKVKDGLGNVIGTESLYYVDAETFKAELAAKTVNYAKAVEANEKVQDVQTAIEEVNASITLEV